MLLAVVVGLVIGAASRLGDRLPSDAAWFFNVIGPWALVSFWIGSRARGWRSGAVLGALVLLVGVAAYYGLTPLTLSRGRARSSLAAGPVWAVGALLGGALYGVAGSWWRRRTPLGPVAVALLGGLLAAEGLLSFYRGGRSGDFLFGVESALGLVLPWMLLDERRERRFAFVLTLLLAVGAFGAVSLIRAVTNSLGG